MRAIWKGAIAFGLVNVPIKVYAATEDHDISLHQVHNEDGGRIRYQRKCEVCGQVVAYQDIDRAYDDGERTVVLTSDDLAALPSERSREIEVVEFVPSDQIDLLTLDRSYFLEPDSSSPKAYVLLRRTLEDTDRTAIVRFSLRQKTRLAALRVRGDVLVLQTLLWADEVRDVSFPSLDESVRISSKELELSANLVESFSSDFDPEEFVDEYQRELRTLIDAKLEQGESLDTAATFGEDEREDTGGEVIDLMDALRASVERSRAARAGKKGSSTEKSGTSKPGRSPSRSGKSDSEKSGSRKSGAGKSGSGKSGSGKSGTAGSSADKAGKPARSSTAKTRSSSTRSSAKAG